MADKSSSAGQTRQGSTGRGGQSARRAGGPELTDVDAAQLSERALLEDFAPASVVVDREGRIRYFHGPIQKYLDIPIEDSDVELASRAPEGLKVKLRETLQQAWTAGGAVSTLAPRVRRNGGVVPVRVRARLLSSPQHDPLCLVSFVDEEPEDAGAKLEASDARVRSMSEEIQSIEAELRTSDARARAFFSNSAVVGWLKDEQGRYVYISETFERHLGVQQQDWIGRTDHEIWPPEVAETLRANDERARRGDDSIEMTEELVTADGRRQQWLVSKFPFVDAAGRRLVGGLAVNITERVKAERALEQNERRLRSLIDNTAVGVAFANADGAVTRANDALLAMLGLTRGEVVRHGLTWANGLLPEDREFADAMRRLSRRADTEPMELQRLDAHGQPVWFLASAVQAHPDDEEYVAFLVNVTQQKLAESALADSEDRLRLAARLAGFGAYYGDLRTGEFIWSDELLRIFGLDEGAPASLDELPGPVIEEDRERVRRTILTSVDPTGDGRFRQEYRVLRPDGETRWILMQGRTVFRREHDRRRASRVAGVALDITQRHRFEEDLQAARREADAANEAKSQFLANMSHEIRTPLTAILGFAEVLEARLDDDDDARACARTITDNGKYLCELLDDILELERIESGRREVHLDHVDVVAVLADVRALMSVPAEDNNLTLSLELDGPVPRAILTDGRFLRQVLLNLVGNALKFTLEGGVRIVCRCRAHRERLEVEVVDTGIGIAEGDRERLFEPFEQGDASLSRSSGGTGLGLAISRDLLAMLGGDISVDSEIGVGSTFRFSVPTGPLDGVEWIESGSVEVGELPAATTADLPMVSGRVLVVDDRRDIRVLVREFIEAAGGEVALAGNGVEALETWRAHEHAGTPFDAVIMDVQMPVLDGLEATRRLRAEGCDRSILALTATIGRAAIERALDAGCSDLIAKPIDRADLLTRLARALRRVDEEPQQLRPQLRPHLRPQRILLVDDHQDSNAALKILLEQQGFSVATAGDAHAALARAREAPPDVALIDLGLPEVPGEELLVRLKEMPELAGCRFVCVSGRSLDAGTWRRLGFDDYLIKPMGMDRLFKLLSSRTP